MDFRESKTKERERKADAERGGGELLCEENQPDLAEEIERPPDRPRDEQGRKASLR
jgi:hypothetical protein